MNEQLDRIEMKLREIDGKITEVEAATSNMRTYMMWSFGITIFMIVVPGLIIAIILPAVLGGLTGALPAGI